MYDYMDTSDRPKNHAIMGLSEPNSKSLPCIQKLSHHNMVFGYSTLAALGGQPPPFEEIFSKEMEEPEENTEDTTTGLMAHSTSFCQKIYLLAQVCICIINVMLCIVLDNWWMLMVDGCGK